MTMKPAERHADLMRQGIWKGVPVRQPKIKAAPVVRACDRCRDWHSGSCVSFQKKVAAYGASK